MNTIKLTVNGRNVDAAVQPRMHLADFLREQLRLTGTHLGCEHGVCGACTVLIDDLPVRSCIAYAVACDGQEVRTIEGFQDDPVMEELRDAFKREHGLQCGFCTPGMLIAARDIVLRLPDADEQKIRRELSGNLCRCTGYIGIVNAVRSVVDSRRARGMLPIPPGRRIVIEKGREPSARAATQALAATGPSRAAAHTTSAAGGTSLRTGWTRFSDSFLIHSAPEKAWAVLSDFSLVVSCIPGAELVDHSERHVKGRLTVKIGPMRAAFSGSADIELDPATLKGHIRGAGSDSGSGSRTKADAIYEVTADPASKGSRVSLTVEYNLQGPLAQFSRSELALEVGRRLISQFSANLNARLIRSDVVATPLDAGALAFASVKSWLGKLLRMPSK